MKMFFRGALSIALLAGVLPAHADVYKCMQDGTVAYRDIPCGEAVDTSNVTILGESSDDTNVDNPITRLQRNRVTAVADAFNEMPAVKEARAKKERVDRAILNHRLTQGMTEADARMVYGTPSRTERDGICRRLIWRNPDHAARVCMSRVSSILY